MKVSKADFTLMSRVAAGMLSKFATNVAESICA